MIQTETLLQVYIVFSGINAFLFAFILKKIDNLCSAVTRLRTENDIYHSRVENNNANKGNTEHDD